MSLETRKLTAGATIPTVGFGTYKIDNDSAEAVVREALAAGYRHIDTAEGYQNEEGVGAAIAGFLEETSSSRDDVFITTKLWPGNPAWGMAAKDYDATIASLEASLERLALDHVDLYLIHAPFAADLRLDQWRALVELRRRGKTRAIGVSNYRESHLEEIRDAGFPLPDANQIELHPWSQKPELVAYLEASEILPIAYSSLVPLSTWRAAEGQESAKTDEMRRAGERGDSPFKQMAAKYGVSEAQVLLRWAAQKGYAVLPKTTNPDRMKQNIDLFSFAIDDADMASMAIMDQGDGVAWSTGDPSKAA
jgi:2,5-diketo-D-gluconate reductase A